MAGVAPWRFVLFNAIGAALWAPLITGMGWFFGASIAQVAARLQMGEEIVLAVVVAAGFGVWMVRRLRRR
jgi:membrane protein DedA with SNARE-associated domain